MTLDCERHASDSLSDSATQISLANARGHGSKRAELLRRVTGSPTVTTAMVAHKPRCQGSKAMNGHVYGLSEIVGTSAQGVDDAIRVGIQRAARTVRGLDWFEVTDIRGHLVDGEIEHFQVTMKIGFRMEDPKQT